MKQLRSNKKNKYQLNLLRFTSYLNIFTLIIIMIITKEYIHMILWDKSIHHNDIFAIIVYHL